jgi:hypothetical protein
MDTDPLNLLPDVRSTDNLNIATPTILPNHIKYRHQVDNMISVALALASTATAAVIRSLPPTFERSGETVQCYDVRLSTSAPLTEDDVQDAWDTHFKHDGAHDSFMNQTISNIMEPQYEPLSYYHTIAVGGKDLDVSRWSWASLTPRHALTEASSRAQRKTNWSTSTSRTLSSNRSRCSASWKTRRSRPISTSPASSPLG